MSTSTTTLSFNDGVDSVPAMSTFTTDHKTFPACDEHRAFTSTSLQHRVGSITVSGMESAEGTAHVAAYVHGTTAVDVAAHVLDDGTTSLVVRLVGEVPTSITIHGITLDDLLAAVQGARVSS